MFYDLNEMQSFGTLDSHTLPHGCIDISHISYIDDIILFTSGSSRSLTRLMIFLMKYENASGQLLNISIDWQTM